MGLVWDDGLSFYPFHIDVVGIRNGGWLFFFQKEKKKTKKKKL